MRHLLDRFSGWLARRILAVFFRHVEVEGAERVPPDGPLLVVANHPNGLIDPVLLLGALPRRVRFVGKSTLWKLPPLRPFLALAGVIPVFRPSDPGVDPSKNREMFARCREALLQGVSIALFPEGTSHAEPSLQPLKTGAARIALGAASDQKSAADDLQSAADLGSAGDSGSAAAPDGPAEPVRVLPVGLTFDARERFRSRALLWVGSPIDAADAAGGRADPEDRGAVAALTAAIGEGLREVTVSYSSWREARLFARAVEIFDRPERELPGGHSLAETHRTAAELARRFSELREAVPEPTRRVAEAMARYDRVLGLLALRDDQVAARYPLLGVARFAARTLAVLLLGLPLAAVGALLNVVPFRGVALLAGRPDLSLEERASWKLFAGLFFYPLGWALEGLAVGWWAGWEWGVATAAAGALTAPVALFFWERGRRLWVEARAYLLLRRRPRVRRRLRAMRAELRAQVEDLARRWENVSQKNR